MHLERTKQTMEYAIEAALYAGIEIMNIYESSDFGIETKQDNSPVTRADIAASNVICKILAKTSIPIICEEIPIAPYSERKNWKQLWIVDPLDGTKDFIMQNGEFTVNIALIENNEAVGGVVYIPASDTLYIGIFGIGSYVIDKVSTRIDSLNWDDICAKANKLPLSQKPEEYTVMASRSFLDQDTLAYINTVLSQKSKSCMLQLGSSLKFLAVASGKAHLYPRLSHIHEWDIAAGHAIASAANCKVYKYPTNQSITYNSETLLSPCFIVEHA